MRSTKKTEISLAHSDVLKMTNVDADKLESTSRPEVCFAIYKGQRRSLASIH